MEFQLCRFSDDPLMNFYTRWPMPLPLCFKNSTATADSVNELLHAEEMVNENAAKKSAYVSTKEPLFLVSITDDFPVNTKKLMQESSGFSWKRAPYIGNIFFRRSGIAQIKNH
jgi:hypothetical protein